MLSVARERTNDFGRRFAIATVPKDSSGHVLMEVTIGTSGVGHGFVILCIVNHPPILLGTSSFTATGWQGSFYPKGLRPADYLSYYAQHFDTVEIDSTFYATPNVSVVRSWNAKTPEGFLFAAKVPQEITHKRVLKDCDEEFKVFLTTMEALGEKLGPLLFQFGKFDKYAFKSLDDFLARLVPFLKRLSKEHKFAVEIRNKDWLVPKLADVLREHGVALTLIDQDWMPRPWEMKGKFDLITANFTYVRWLGDRKGMEEKTTTWDKVIVDRQGDLSDWVGLLKKIHERRIMILAFANNHYAGFGPGTVDLFRRLWGMEAPRVVHRPQRTAQQSLLFD
jgi:uncharacterized protein YecE (DUF72 family)